MRWAGPFNFAAVSATVSGERDAQLATMQGATTLSERFDTLGFLIIGLFVVAWLPS